MSVPATNTETNAQFEARQAAEIQKLLQESQAVRAANQTQPPANPSPNVQQVLDQIHQTQVQNQLVANNELETSFATYNQLLASVTNEDINSIVSFGQQGSEESFLEDLFGINPLAMFMGGGEGMASFSQHKELSIGEAGDARMKPAIEALTKLRNATFARLKDANFIAAITGAQASQLQVGSRMDAAIAKVLHSVLAQNGGNVAALQELLNGNDGNAQAQIIDTAIEAAFEADVNSKARHQAVNIYSQANRSFSETMKGSAGALAGIFEKMFSNILPQVIQHEEHKGTAVNQLIENMDNAATPQILDSIAKILTDASAKLRAEQQVQSQSQTAPIFN